ncbi:protein translocase subunit SecD [Candidatus Dependentiae bacterium]|nr:protein translocase subunit SecD [Candidatus Dependentiae bacterium]
MNSSVQKALTSGFAMWVFAAIAMVGYLYKQGRKDIRYGIDLVGGTYITLEVQQDDVIKNFLNDRVRNFESLLKSSKIEMDGVPFISNNSLIFSFFSEAAAKEAETLFRSEERKLRYEVDGAKLKITMSNLDISQSLEKAVESNVDILRNRLESRSGCLSEIHISKQGEKQIVVELPDVKDPREAKTMIGKSAVLEFKLVEDDASSKEGLLNKYDHELPEGTIIVPGRRHGHDDESTSYYLLPVYAPVSGNYLKNAKMDFAGETRSDIVVAFEFDKEGGKRFHELTGDNIGKRLAIVLDGEVISAPTINQAIGSRGVIQGGFTADEARTLAKLLKSGSFKAKVEFIEERQIGPTLGQESINQGLLSCIIGLILLLFFGIFYYKLSGIFSFITLVYNLLFLLMIMAMLKATLTLPGIAGMVLTIGMAIDSSILIYERVKEAIKDGMTVSVAVEDGFADAMWVILDSNITTFIVAAVLYYFGTGPIQGFAVTMMIGIVTTLITGLFFLKSLFKFYLRTFNVQKLSI